MFYGWRVVGVCFVAALFTWGLGVFGGSIYLSELGHAHDWPTTLVSSALTVFYLANALSLPTIGAAIDRWGAQPVIVIGTFLLAAGVTAVGRLETVWQLYATFCCMGLGYATMSVTSLSATIAPWFERHQGRSVALALSGASFGAMLVVPLLVLAISLLGFRAATLYCAIVLLVTMLPLALIVLRFREPAEIGLNRDGTLEAKDLPEAPLEASRLIRRNALKSLSLWSVAVGFALGLMVQVGFLTHHYALAEPMLGSKAAGLLVGGTGFAGLIGRLVLAHVIDHLDPRRYSMAIFAIQTIALSIFACWPVASVLLPVSLVYGFCLGQITTLSPIVVRREFGAAAFGTVYSVAGTAIQLCSAFGPLLYGALVTWLGGYPAVLGVAAVFKMAAIAALAFGLARASRTNLPN